MDRWVPLFEILLNSAAPERDAALWFDDQRRRSPTSPPSTSAFLSLLLSAQTTQQNPPPFILSLPPFLQTRILSFLAAESLRFSRRHIQTLAAGILNSDLPSSSDHPAFWVHRAARHLLDAASAPFCKDEFDAVPHFLRNSAGKPLLPWLPLPPEVPKKTRRIPLVFEEKPESKSRDFVSQNEESGHGSLIATPLDPHHCEKVAVLKAEILACDSTSEALRIACEIQKLCLDYGHGNQLTMLGLIEPWEADDETSSVLLSNLSGDRGLGCDTWLSNVLCSICLPKFLTLRKPASRVLLSATIGFCKLHPAAAVEALIFPLAFRKEGINVVLCDVVSRILKECLHPSHVSAFCQRLLCREEKDRRPIYLPCHRDLISDDVVWTEPMFTLFQHILNQNVCLTPDAVDQLVLVIDEMTSKFSRSLKFANFFLCFVSKCTLASKLHRVELEKAAEKTDTFVTKSILSKLGGTHSPSLQNSSPGTMSSWSNRMIPPASVWARSPIVSSGFGH